MQVLFLNGASLDAFSTRKIIKSNKENENKDTQASQNQSTN